MIIKRILSLSIISTLLISPALADKANHSYVEMDSVYSYKMMDPTTDISKKQQFLFKNKDEHLSEGTLYIGASVIAIADYQTSNRESKFGYLMRHPTATNQIGKEVSEIALHSVQVQASGSLTPWMALYSELLYNPQQSFGGGNNTSLGRNQVQVRKAYILLGDKNEYPIYASFGKQDVPFGLMDTVSPFTASTVWHAFGPLAYSGIIGIDMAGFNASVTAIQGGAQFRSANVPVKGTNVPSRINNFAADISYSHEIMNRSNIMVGASYIKGSAYNQEFPVTHFNPGKKHNPAWDVYARLKLNNLTLQGEFAQTLKKWPGTHNPSPPLNIFAASKVSSFSVGGKYNFQNLICKKDVALSIEYSEFKAGPKGAPWRLQSQIVAGISSMVRPNVKIFGEAIRIQGYAPLNNISGDLNGISGTTHSDKSARTHAFIVGLQASL